MRVGPDKETIRDEIAATRVAYHELLASISAEDWTRVSGNPDLTVKELMWHMAWATGWMASSIDAIRKGRSFSPISGSLADLGRRFAIRWLARRATREAAARRYDEGHAAVLARLETVRDDEWHREAKRFGNIRTVAWYFGQPARHFAEHAADVCRGLGRADEGGSFGPPRGRAEQGG